MIRTTVALISENFSKNTCHHVIGILIRLGFKCPHEAKEDNLYQKRLILVFFISLIAIYILSMYF